MSRLANWRKLRTEPLQPGATLTRAVFQDVEANEVAVNAQAGAGSNTASNGVYVNWPTANPLVLTFNKRFSDSIIVCQFHVSAFSTVVASNVGWAVLGQGADRAMGSTFYNIANCHFGWSFVNQFTGVPAGSATWTMRVKLFGAGLNITADPNDTNSMTIREVQP